MQPAIRCKAPGFSLIELLIVVAIVGILASIAYPAYSTHIRKGRRSDAMQAMSLIQLSQERYRSNHPRYAESLADIGVSSETSSGGHYKLAIDGESTAIGYSASATATGRQSDDSSCRVMSISVIRGSATLNPAACW